jgi:hypothetical protein
VVQSRVGCLGGLGDGELVGHDWPWDAVGC